MAKEKNLSIETIRGFAILLVVVGHVIGSAPDGGMRVDYPSPWRYLYSVVQYIQMPLFTAIAGWIYALKPVSSSSLKALAFNKLKRLLIPMATVGTLYFLVQYFVPGTNNKEALSSIWHIYLFPYTMYWYLQALFLMIMVVAVTDLFHLTTTFKGWCIALGISYILYIVEITLIPAEVPNFFSFKMALNRLPGLLVGVGVYRFREIIIAKKYRPLHIFIALAGFALLQIKWFCPNLNPELYNCLLPIWVTSTLILIFHLDYINKFFVYFGAYAYSIYLFHGFGTAGGRIILSYMQVYSPMLIFIFSSLLGALLPVLVDKILDRNKYTRMLFLGKPFRTNT